MMATRMRRARDLYRCPSFSKCCCTLKERAGYVVADPVRRVISENIDAAMRVIFAAVNVVADVRSQGGESACRRNRTPPAGSCIKARETPLTEVGYSSDPSFLAPVSAEIQRCAATVELTAMECGRWERIYGFWTIKARYERRPVQTLFRQRCTSRNERTRLPIR